MVSKLLTGLAALSTATIMSATASAAPSIRVATAADAPRDVRADHPVRSEQASTANRLVVPPSADDAAAQPSLNDWNARMVHGCVRSGNRMSC